MITRSNAALVWDSATPTERTKASRVRGRRVQAEVIASAILVSTRNIRVLPRAQGEDRAGD